MEGPGKEEIEDLLASQGIVTHVALDSNGRPQPADDYVPGEGFDNISTFPRPKIARVDTQRRAQTAPDYSQRPWHPYGKDVAVSSSQDDFRYKKPPEVTILPRRHDFNDHYMTERLRQPHLGPGLHYNKTALESHFRDTSAGGQGFTFARANRHTGFERFSSAGGDGERLKLESAAQVPGPGTYHLTYDDIGERASRGKSPSKSPPPKRRRAQSEKPAQATKTTLATKEARDELHVAKDVTKERRQRFREGRVRRQPKEATFTVVAPPRLAPHEMYLQSKISATEEAVQNAEKLQAMRDSTANRPHTAPSSTGRRGVPSTLNTPLRPLTAGRPATPDTFHSTVHTSPFLRRRLLIGSRSKKVISQPAQTWPRPKTADLWNSVVHGSRRSEAVG